MDEFSGTVFANRYEITALIEDNGIIHTYRAYQDSLKRPVSIHVLSPKDRNDPHWPKAFIKGAEIAAQYAHPNIAPIYDLGTHEGIDYVALRYLEGGTLEEKISQGQVEVTEAASIVKQVAAALDYVHSQGGVHGDPATINIVFDAWGSAFLADFYLLGLLKTVDMRIMAGVPAFMAPERMQGLPPTALSDQYALASVAYKTLTGERPWGAGTQARRTETLMLPQEIRPEIPEAINDVLFRAMASHPEDRFPTVMEFARQFERALEAMPEHVFISYSRQDADYLHSLKAYLDTSGFQVWVDDRIESGQQWFLGINDAIRNCAAFVVIMSPEAETSEWVLKEILLAKRYNKPIFPVLLRGDEFPILIDLQFADARDGKLPDADFHRRLARTIFGS